MALTLHLELRDPKELSIQEAIVVALRIACTLGVQVVFRSEDVEVAVRPRDTYEHALLRWMDASRERKKSQELQNQLDREEIDAMTGGAGEETR